MQKEKEERESFLVKLLKIDGKKAEVNNKRKAERVVTELKKSDFKVSDIRKREVKKSPYPPFTTSTLTQTAARFFGWSAKKTMMFSQRLYEEGLITYHRTDSTNIAKLAINGVRTHIEKEFGTRYLPSGPRVYKTKSKVAQEAHEAIRPTKVDSKFKIRNEKFEKDGKRLYELIWKRFVACQMADSIYDETRIDVFAKSKVKSQKSKVYLLRVGGQIMKFDGWRKIIRPLKKEEPQLPDVEKNEPLQLIKVDSQQKFTEPPPRFSEASLIKKLEELGIGRPSTYVPTISTIQLRQYVEKKEARFHPTPVGTTVNDFLIKNFPKIFNYSFTAKMESDLDEVANGNIKWTDMMGDFYKPFEKKLEQVEEKSKRVKIETEKLGKACPECKKGELVVRIGRYGKFVSCSRFPDCDYRERYLEKIGMKCPECGKGDVIIKKTGKGRQFYGCSRYPDCKWASWQKPKNGSTSSS